MMTVNEKAIYEAWQREHIDRKKYVKRSQRLAILVMILCIAFIAQAVVSCSDKDISKKEAKFDYEDFSCEELK